MNLQQKILGIDIGGTHISAGLVDTRSESLQTLHLLKKDFDSTQAAYEILQNINTAIQEILANGDEIESVGIAFPGPFDYDKGVAAISNVGGKFSRLFGLNIKQVLSDFTGLQKIPFYFANDAYCFAKGAYSSYQLNSKRTAFLTIGTGFGSAFMSNGQLIKSHPSLPVTGMLFNEAFQTSIADDHFSSRWFVKTYQQKTGKNIASVKLIAEQNDQAGFELFQEFGANLGSFLLPWFNNFEVTELVIGGNIAKSDILFSATLKEQLAKLNRPLSIIFCEDTESCILKGAALLATEKIKDDEYHLTTDVSRKTTQPLLPAHINPTNHKGYDIYPSIRSDQPVWIGFETLAEKICHQKTLVIDGYGGVHWESFREGLHLALLTKNKKVFWYDIDSCLYPPDTINKMLEGYINNDDKVFGKKYRGVLDDFFDPQLLQLLVPDNTADLCIVYGTGAALSRWQGMLLYADIPKNEIQYRSRAGSVKNIGCAQRLTNSAAYQRFYFIDWPVLNKHKSKLLPSLDFILDEQKGQAISWMSGDDFRSVINDALAQPFRARPWFEAGVWGGQWMKENIAGLSQEEINYAWSFELITPENGILIEGNGNLLEVSFDYLLYSDNKKLLGKAAKRFGMEFPIRFDFLDTMDGGNLSIQCHPRTHYIREQFGENFTQDETYYILECKPGAQVYLGFQNTIHPPEFKKALYDALDHGVELESEKFVQQFTSKKHDLFLIPNGTIHASGKNNLVLEISSTPYIYTFKMYDWQRLDLNGQPRPINIEHAFKNLYFDRKGPDVIDQLISKPKVTAQWTTGRRVKLNTHEDHFYTIDRFEFTGVVNINTNDQCHICMLVEGDLIEVNSAGKSYQFCYAETFIIPAHVKQYSLKQKSDKKAYVLIAYVKDECCGN